MKKHAAAISIVLIIMTSSHALALGPGKSLEFMGSRMGTLTVDGTTHKDAGLK